jgi:hypothetical protein
MQRLETRSRDRVGPANGSVSVVPPVTPRASPMSTSPAASASVGIPNPDWKATFLTLSGRAFGVSLEEELLAQFRSIRSPGGNSKAHRIPVGPRGLRFLNALGLINAATNTELAIISSPRALPRATAGDRRVPRGRCGHVETLTSSQNLTVDAHRLGLESAPFRTFASASMKSPFRADALFRRLSTIQRLPSEVAPE